MLERSEASQGGEGIIPPLTEILRRPDSSGLLQNDIFVQYNRNKDVIIHPKSLPLSLEN